MTVHIYGPRSDNTIRVRAWCPEHQRLCYGRYVAYYDTTHLAFDCRTHVDLGYGVWRGVPGPRGGCRLRSIRKRDWARWSPHFAAWRRRTLSENSNKIKATEARL